MNGEICEDGNYFIPFDEFEKEWNEKNSPVFEIRRTLAKEDFKEFRKFTFFKYRRGVLIFTLIFELIMVRLGVSVMSAGIGTGWVFILAAVMTAVYMAVYGVRAERSNLRKAGCETVYLFYGDNMINLFGGNEVRVNYADCEVYEYGERIFIIVYRKEGFIISSSDLGNNIEGFRDFLKEKFGDKYKGKGR